MINFSNSSLLIYAFFIWILYSVLYVRRTGNNLSSWLRSFAMVLLLVGILSPELNSFSSLNKITVLYDVSNSISTEKESLLSQKLSETIKSARKEVIGFAEKVVATDSDSLSSIRRKFTKGELSETSFEEALQSSLIKDHSKIVLLSDGWITKGKTRADIIQIAKDRQLKIYPIIPDKAKELTEYFGLSIVSAPLIVSTKGKTAARISVENNSKLNQIGKLSVKLDDLLISEKNVKLDQNKSATEDVSLTLKDQQKSKVDVLFVPENKKYKPTKKTLYISSKEREKILLLSGTTEDETLLKSALSSQAYKIDSFIGRNISEEKLLTEYSVVILNNITSADLGSQRAESIKTYVQNGGGLVMIGGNRSFGLGGYIGSPIEKILPVVLEPPQTIKKRVNVAVQLVIDKSRSMNEEQRLLYAKEAAKEVVKTLKNDDYVGIIGFDDTPFVVVRMAQVSSVRGNADERIERLYSSRGTRLMPAMQEARRDLELAPAGRKHMIILTDGKLPDGGPLYVELVQDLKRRNISVSTFMLGGEPTDELLRAMANAGGGSFYQTRDPSQLPKLFLKDVQVNTGEQTLKELNEFMVRRGPGDLKTTQILSYPLLRGYVATRPKEGANLELVVSDSQESRPLLASGTFGKGKAIAFTSDLNGRWSSEWLQWGKYIQFCRDIINSLRNNEEDSLSLDYDYNVYTQDGSLFVDLTLFSEIPESDITGMLSFEDKSIPVNFKKKTSGRYVAIIQDIKPGTYTISSRVKNQNLTPITYEVLKEDVEEISFEGFNTEFLEELAFQTGGKRLVSPNEILNNEPELIGKRSLSNILFLAATFFLLLSSYLGRRRHF